MQQRNNLAGAMFILIIMAISIATALSYIGNSIEQIITFISQIMTFFVVIGLYGIWQGIKIFDSRILRVVGIAYPLIVAISSLYPIIEYAEQSIPSYYIYMNGLEMIFALFITSIFIRESVR